METVSDFILGGSKITAGGDCSHEIKRRLLLGRSRRGVIKTGESKLASNHFLMCSPQSGHLRDPDDTTLMAENEEELKSLLMKLKVESEKVGLKLNIQDTKIMAPGPITSWEIDRDTVETVTDFILGAPKSLQIVTAAMKLKDTCFLEEKL